MWLNRKVTIRRLNNVSLSYPLDLLRHLALLRVITDMLDHSIRKNNLKLLIFQFAHVPGIANDSGNIRKCRFDWPGIQNSEMDIILDEAHGFPENLRSTYIKDVERSGKAGYQRCEESEALSAKIGSDGERPWLVYHGS